MFTLLLEKLILLRGLVSLEPWNIRGTYEPAHQRSPADFADELEQVSPHEEEAAGERTRDADIPDERVGV